MGTEIERKFLVDRQAWDRVAAELDFVDIQQGYLAARADLSVRVRVCGDIAKLTVKGATKGFTRDEFEYDIPVGDARDLLSLCGGHNIEKRRYTLDVDGHEWVVDVFRGDNRGLVIAEIELDSEGEAFTRPGWLGNEVSGEPAYFNSSLSQKPYSFWSSASGPEHQ